MEEYYGKLGEEENFGVAYWQRHEVSVLFEAATDLVRDYLLLRGENADEPRILRTVESFEKVQGAVPDSRRLRRDEVR